jgi:adenylyltransferase/sulfurtransferase
MQATEAIKLLLGIGTPMIGRMMLYDALDMEFNTIKIRKNPSCPVCSVPAAEVELIDYEQFCGMPAHDRSQYTTNDDEAYKDIHHISPAEAQARLAREADVVLLDVRDPHEWAIASLGQGLYIPKGEIQQAKNAILVGRKLESETPIAQIPRDKTLLVLCRSGKRSADSILFLREIGYDNDKMFNIEGGILAWSRELDPSLPQY